MDSWCKKLYRFVDGELAAADEEHFRLHLSLCRACASGLHDAMQLELLSVQALYGALSHNDVPPPSRSERSPRLRLPAVSGGRRSVLGPALALGLGALAALLLPSALRTDELWRPGATERGLEARIAYAPADRYLPYVPDRAGSGAPVTPEGTPPVSLRALATLEARGDLHGVAAAWLLRGEVRQAADFLARSAPSADRDCDRAVVALEAGDLQGALALLDGVLREAPEHPQALWNRALVLRALGQPLRAAEAFESVVRKGEPGWSEEAGIRARALRRGGSWMN